MKTKCFLDFEFNTNVAKHRKYPEVVSMGAVFVDESFEELKEYYTIVRPSKKTHVEERCLKYTGITRTQIERSPNFQQVTKDFLKLVDEYKPDEFIVWGNSDASVVINSVICAGANRKMARIASDFVNYQKEVKSILETRHVFNLERMAKICNLSYKHEFSALKDAKCLSKIYKCMSEGSYNIEIFERYEHMYESNRFIGEYENKRKGISYRKQHLDLLKKELKELKKGQERYALCKEEIAEQKMKLKELEHFCKANRKRYEAYISEKQ